MPLLKIRLLRVLFHFSIEKAVTVRLERTNEQRKMLESPTNLRVVSTLATKCRRVVKYFFTFINFRLREQSEKNRREIPILKSMKQRYQKIKSPTQQKRKIARYQYQQDQ